MTRLRSRDERGSVLPIVAMAMVLLLGMAAFTVDIGMQRVARRDMQALADIVALDLARLVDGRDAAAIRAGMPGPALALALRESVDRNDKDTVGGRTEPTCAPEETGSCVNAYLVALDDEGNFATDPQGLPSEVAPSSVPDAVVVVASTQVGFAFAPVLGVGAGTATRSAVAASDSNACFSIGSFAIGLGRDPDGVVDLLSPLLGDSSLTVGSYKGMAHAYVTLLNLISAPNIGVGSVDELLAATDITVGDLFLATAYALRRSDPGDLATIELLDNLATSSTVAWMSLSMADVIDLSTAGEGVLDASINVLDLVGGAVSAVNGTNFVGAPAVDVAIPGLSNTHASTSIIERPHLACGVNGARADTAQLKLNAGGVLVTKVVTIPGVGTVNLDGSIATTDNVASATGVLGDVTCNPDVVPVKVSSGLATLAVSVPLTITGDDLRLGAVSGVPGLNGGLITGDISATQQATSTKSGSDAGTVLSWTIPPESYDAVKSSSASGVELPSVTLGAPTVTVSEIRVGGVPLDSITLLGIPLGDLAKSTIRTTAQTAVTALLAATGTVGQEVATLVAHVVDPFVDNVNEALDKLAGILGLRLGGADVRVVPTASCNHPSLRG